MTDSNPEIIETNNEIERNWSMLAHLVGLVPIPFLNVACPFLVWFLKKDESVVIATHAKEAVNFQITILLAWFIALWLSFFVIGIFILWVLVVVNLVLVILGALKAKKGEKYRYPVSLRFF